MISSALFAQTVVQTVIGNTSGPGSFFYGPFYRGGANSNTVNYSRHAYIYTASELNIPSGSKIIKLEWMKKDTARVIGNNIFNVLISNTTATSFPVSVLWSTLISGTTQVFSSSTFDVSGGANTYIQAPFTDSFTYYGGNIQVLTDWNKLGFATGAVPFYSLAATGKSIGTATTAPLSGNSTLQTATYGGSRPTMRITYVTVPPCSGPPAPGNTVASLPYVCSGVPFTLSLQNGIPGGLVSYQWQSADNINFTLNLVSNLGSFASVITSQTSNKYYRCIVTCGSQSTISTPLLVPMSPNYGCYCTSRAISDADEDIFKFRFGNSQNCSDCSTVPTGVGSVKNIYSNYQYLTPATVQKGSTVPFSIEIGECNNHFYSNTCAIYIDYNQNMSFADPGELAYSSPGATSGAHTEIGNIVIPANAVTGLTGLRVINAEQSSSINSPCLTYSYGETEDYVVNIQPTSACSGYPNPGNTIVDLPGACSLISGTYASCSGKSINVTLENLSPNTGLSYQWYSNNGLISGATSPIYITPVLFTPQIYFCKVSCSNSGLTSSSNPITINMADFSNCYCSSGAGGTSDEEILNFSLNAANNASNCTVPATGPGSILNRYSNFTNLGVFTDLQIGSSASFSVLQNDCDIPPPPYFSFGTSVWIDYNRNGSFDDAGEQVFIENTAIAGPRTISGSFIIPCTAREGLTRLRVTIAEGISGAALNSCLLYNFGETEDYLVNLSPLTSTVDFNFGTTTVTANATSSSIANLTVGAITQGNNANTAQSTLLISNSNPSTYSGASAQMNAAITARNRNLQLSDTSAYFQFVLTPSANYQIVLDSIFLGSYSSSTGPTTLDIRTSANNYLTSIGAISVSANSTWTNVNLMISKVVSNTPLTIRIYGYVIGGNGSVTTGNTTPNWYIDDIKVKVRVRCTPICNVLAATLSSPIICNGGTSNLTAYAVNAVGTVSYKLNNNAFQSSAVFPNLTPGTYTVTVMDENLCTASTVKVINPTPIVTTNINTTACGSYTWFYNGQTYTNTGFYTSTGLTPEGCPRFDTLQLTVIPNTTSSLSASACGSYLWTANNTTYTNSGIYTYVSGCNTATLNLTITPITSSSTSVTACNFYFWAFNNTTYTASGVYTVVNGCNSTILNLTIIPSTSSSTTVSACGSYLWTVNNTTYTAGGTYTNTNGCHTSILNLTIIPITSSTSTITSCASYFWPVNNTTYTASGNYSFINGCHTSLLNLTIIPIVNNSTTVSTCGSYTWPENAQTYTISGVYTSVNGCTTSTLNLTITPCNSLLQVKAFFQGYYQGASDMRPVLFNQGVGTNTNITDSIEVILFNSTSPYAFVASVKTIINRNGIANCIFPALTGNYFIAIKHRNGLLTWSATPQAISSVTAATYDFSDSNTKAYGSNLKQVDTGVWAIYAGDLNGDANIDLLDLTTEEASILNFDFGYQSTDLNGDGNVDLLDSPLLEDNINNFIFSITP